MGKAVAKSNKRAWRKLDASATEVRRTPQTAHSRGWARSRRAATIRAASRSVLCVCVCVLVACVWADARRHGAAVACPQTGLVADSRELLRSAGPASKGDDELFFVDKQGVGMRKGRREPWALKSTQIISANPKIPVVPKNTITQKKWHTETGKLERMKAQLQETGQIAEYARKKPRRAAPAPAAAERAFDLWGEEEEDSALAKVVAPGAGVCPVNPTASNGWPTVYKNNPHVLTNAVDSLDPERGPVGTKKRKYAATQMKPVPSKVRPVEVVEAGASYRPTPQAHELLMSRAAAMFVQEEEKVKVARERLGLKEGQRIKRANLARKQLAQPGADDLSDQDDDYEEEEEEEGEVRRVPASRAADASDDEEEEQTEGMGDGQVATGKGTGKDQSKLTKTQRNKQARHRERERKLQEAREKKKLDKQLNALGEISKTVKKMVQRSEEETKLRAELKPEREAEKIHRLGPNKLTVNDFIPDVQLPEEIAPRLRVVKQSGSAIRDKFLNLSKRNLVEPRKVTKDKRKNKTLNTRKSDKLKARAYIDF